MTILKKPKMKASSADYTYDLIELEEATEDAAFLLSLAEKLSKGVKLSKDVILSEILPGLHRNHIAASMQLMIAQHLENPPREPRMTKLAPIMAVLFPKVREAVITAYIGNLEPVDWTRSAEYALKNYIQSEMDSQTRRDIIQAIVTDYVYLELGNRNDLQRWSEIGGLIS